LLVVLHLTDDAAQAKKAAQQAKNSSIVRCTYCVATGKWDFDRPPRMSRSRFPPTEGNFVCTRSNFSVQMKTHCEDEHSDKSWVQVRHDHGIAVQYTPDEMLVLLRVYVAANYGADGAVVTGKFLRQ